MSKIPDSFINDQNYNSYMNSSENNMSYKLNNALNRVIKADISCEKLKIKQKETDDRRLKILEKILSMPSYSMNDYETKKFMYNEGKFRVKEEMIAYNEKEDKKEKYEQAKAKQIQDYNYYQSGQYSAECEKGKVACWIPVFIYLGLFILGLCDIESSYNMLLFLFFTSPIPLVISLILMRVQSNRCINLAEEHNIPKYDKDYQNAVSTKRAATAGLTGAAITAAHSSKELKSMTDPDTWNVLK